MPGVPGIPLVSPTNRNIPTGMESALKHDLGKRLVQIRPRSSGLSASPPRILSRSTFVLGVLVRSIICSPSTLK